MDMDFTIIRSLVPRSRLLSGFCSSARALARRFLRTSFRIDALALRYPSPPSGWGKTFTSKLSHMLGTRNDPPAEPAAFRLLAPQRGLIATAKKKSYPSCVVDILD